MKFYPGGIYQNFSIDALCRDERDWEIWGIFSQKAFTIYLYRRQLSTLERRNPFAKAVAAPRSRLCRSPRARERTQ